MPSPDPMPVSRDPLPETVKALGWTSFLTDLSSEAIYPLLPALVKSLGGTSLDIGLIDGVANAVAALVRLVSGALSDRVGRRPLVLLGYCLSAIVRPHTALASAPPVTAVGSVVSSAPAPGGSGCGPTLHAVAARSAAKRTARARRRRMAGRV